MKFLGDTNDWLFDNYSNSFSIKNHDKMNMETVLFHIPRMPTQTLQQCRG